MPLSDAVLQSANLTPTAGGLTYLAHLNTEVADFVIQEDLTILQDTQTNKSYVQFAQQLPPYCRVMWWELQNVTDNAVTGNDTTITANSIALFNSTATAPTTGTQSGSGAIFGYIGTASNSRTRGIPYVNTQGQNVSTIPNYLYIAPAVATNAGTGAQLNINTGATNGYKFGTGTATVTNTGTLRARVYVRQYLPMPS